MELILKKENREIANGPLSKLIMDYMINCDVLTLARIVYENTSVVTGKIRNENIVSSFLFFIAKWPLLDFTERDMILLRIQSITSFDWEEGNLGQKMPFWLDHTKLEIINHLDMLSNLDIEIIECN